MNQKIKSPITKGVAKVPVVMQLETLECGAACLDMVMAYYDKWIPLEKVRVDCGVSRDGSNARNILRAARMYGFVTRGVTANIKALKEKIKLPCIIHWDMSHFVVLCGFIGKKAVINDPARGKLFISLEEFDKSFTGIVLEIVPGEDFAPSGKRKSMVKFAKKRLVGAASLVVFFALTTIIFYFIGIINPVVKQVFIDNLLDGKNPDWLLPFIFVTSLITVLQLIVNVIQSLYNYKVSGKLALVGSTTFMWQILRMPIDFFSQRMTGDIQQRKNENANIARTLVNVFAPLVFNTLMLVFYLVVMIHKSWILTLLGVGTIFANAILTYFISEQKVNIARVQARDYAKLSGMTSKGIEMIETIKASGAEKNYFYSWSEVQASAANQRLKLARVNQFFGILPSILTLMVNYGVLIIGIFLTLNKQFSVGSIVAFQGFLSAFMSPALLIINSGQTLQEMRTQMERVDDVMEYPTDPNIDREISDTEYRQLSGELEIKNITFGYSRLANPIFKDFSLVAKKGETIAIVGGTGSGKSTLSKLISGLYDVWDGKILYDGKKITEIDHEVFVSSIAVVDQDIILFEDTIMNNIKMWDDTISNEEAIRAAKDARIDGLIMSRKGQYFSMLNEGGKNLSGGERQRIEIARALASNPSIIILDEATSALDAQTEYEVVNAIKQRGITTIVVAHRLSTIRDADRIIVLDKGEIIEQGRHEELMAKGGYYYNLIKND